MSPDQASVRHPVIKCATAWSCAGGANVAEAAASAPPDTWAWLHAVPWGSLASLAAFVYSVAPMYLRSALAAASEISHALECCQWVGTSPPTAAMSLRNFSMSASCLAVYGVTVPSCGRANNVHVGVSNAVVFDCGRHAVNTTNYDRVIVTSSDLRDVVSATKILISGATTQVTADNIT